MSNHKFNIIGHLRDVHCVVDIVKDIDWKQRLVDGPQLKVGLIKSQDNVVLAYCMETKVPRH